MSSALETDRAPEQQYEGVRAVEEILEQQYGVRIYEDESGQTVVQLRIGGLWSEPLGLDQLEDVVG